MFRRPAGVLVGMYLVAAVAMGCRKESKGNHLVSGGQAYLAQCAVCHGTESTGDGPLAASIAASGKTPPPALDATLVAALGRKGVRAAIASAAHERDGSAMPLWGPHLGDMWMDRIADYVVAAPKAETGAIEARTGYLAAPAGTPAEGRRAYVMYCSGCHGPQGQGDGFFSHALDSRLKPSPLGASSKRKLDDAGIAAIIGLGGAHAPNAATMPGWLYTISAEDRLALAGYLRTLLGSAEGH